MQTITTIGLDIAKSVFQVHGVDAGGQVLIRRQLKRRQVLAFFQKLPSCLVGIEACASEGHDSIAFMEKMVTDPTVEKVIIVSDRVYAEKADGRRGGVGTEAQII